MIYVDTDYDGESTGSQDKPFKSIRDVNFCNGTEVRLSGEETLIDEIIINADNVSLSGDYFLNGGGNKTCFRFNGDNPDVEGLTLHNAGRAIYHLGGYPYSFNNNTIFDCVTGIIVQASHTSVTG